MARVWPANWKDRNLSHAFKNIPVLENNKYVYIHIHTSERPSPKSTFLLCQLAYFVSCTHVKMPALMFMPARCQKPCDRKTEGHELCLIMHLPLIVCVYIQKNLGSTTTDLAQKKWMSWDDIAWHGDAGERWKYKWSGSLKTQRRMNILEISLVHTYTHTHIHIRTSSQPRRREGRGYILVPTTYGYLQQILVYLKKGRMKRVRRIEPTIDWLTDWLDFSTASIHSHNPAYLSAKVDKYQVNSYVPCHDQWINQLATVVT